MSEEDRELLRLAAKAAGIQIEFLSHANGLESVVAEHADPGKHVTDGYMWNPLGDDGDALRLAVLLSLRIEPYTGVKMGTESALVANITDVYSLHSYKVALSESHGLDPNPATRRAIVRAAAEIGKATA